MNQMLDKGREFIKDKQAVLTEAVDTGRTPMHGSVSDCPAK